MRRPPGLRGSWLPGLGDAPAPAASAAPAAPAIPAAPPRSTGVKSSGFAPTRPFDDFRSTRPLSDFQATQPLSDFQATRPISDFQPTRPVGDFQPTRPVSDFQPTRPVGDFQPTRPAGDLPPGAAPAVTRRVASTPAAAVITPPSAEGHWQVRGTPGQNLVLMPGQMHLGQQVASLRTLLGSCVAITLWHPLKRIGGMCHFLLPKRTRRAGDAPDGRYGDEAVAEMVRTLSLLRTDPKDYVAHLYGGADTMSGVSAARFNIGERNIEQGWALIEQYGFQLDGIDVGEDIPRTVALNLATGAVTMRRGQGQAPDHLRS